MMAEAAYSYGSTLEGGLQALNRRDAGYLPVPALAMIAAVSAWTPFLIERFAQP